MEKSKKSLGAGFDSVTGRIRRFCADTVAEMRRCSWPSRRQLLESTVLVVVAMVILACFVAGVDEIAMWLIRLVTVRG
ncbi:MAG: preprotein translocase subunit SecE [Lentisphaerae bacterium]|nr:preprotein translocase subunit SecE [Lentisphaerota bacterium]